MVTQQSYGRAGDRRIQQFTLRNAKGSEVRAIEYGGIITAIRTPDRNGAFENIVLGLDSIDAYLADRRYYGAIVGRYANRIADGRFTIDGQTYQLSTNDGRHHLHGGVAGFHRALWDGAPMADRNGVRFARISPDGEEGYPGALDVRVSYELTDANELVVDYEATTTRPTHVNLTQHSYFNLAGDGNHLATHQVSIAADRYTRVDDMLLPTGVIASVAGTPLDFRRLRTIGDVAYDHNFILNRTGGGLQPAARVVEPASGRTLEVSTTEPGLQFYTGRGGLCLETQHFADSPNRPDFPSTLLRPGETYRSSTTFKFAVD